jgi:sulfate adenylyltransferase subunit 1 (EFTu-like GTPase family)
VQTIPISALEGDNIVTRSERTEWYVGPTLLEHLEIVPIRRPVSTGPLRLPIQHVIRPDANFRGFAGQIASGRLAPGDEVLALPSRQRTTVKSIASFDGDLAKAFTPMSVTVTLNDEIDLSRGDMLVGPAQSPEQSRRFEAMLVWMHSQPMQLSQTFLLKHTTRTTRAQALRIVHRVNISSLRKEPTRQLQMNDIASVELQTVTTLFFDRYEVNRTTGSFILIDPISNATVAAGMISRSLGESGGKYAPVSAAERRAKNGHRPAVIAVKTRELAEAIERKLFDEGYQVIASDEDTLSGYGVLSLVKLAVNNGFVVIVSGETIATNEIARGSDDVSILDLTSLSSVERDEALQRVASLARSLRNLGDSNDI